MFERAAHQRLTTAVFLLTNGFHLDAVYLAGYAIECALKALVLKWTPGREFDAMLQRLVHVGAKGHDYEYLKGLLKERRGQRNRPDRETLGALTQPMHVAGSWSMDLRYQIGAMDLIDAEQFIAAATTVYEVCKRG